VVSVEGGIAEATIAGIGQHPKPHVFEYSS
jgi:hypothetical protein